MNKEKVFLYFKIIIILITLIAASYSWFTNGQKLKMDSLSITTKAVQSLSFSLDGGVTWDDNTSLNIDENFKFSSEITGDGIDLYVPAVRREDGSPISFKKATNNKDYLEFEIMFKTENATDIFLDDTSFVQPTAGIKDSDLIGTDVTRKSSMGDFSRDLIAGSVRVAFIEDNEVKMVWAPNPNYELVKNSTNYTFNLSSKNIQNYNYLNPTDLTEMRVNRIKDNLNASYSRNTSGGDYSLLTFNSPDEVKSITVRIWVEGNDRETSTALKGGVFRIFFNFIGITKQVNKSIPEVTVNDLTVEGLDSSMEYSIDYGNNWISYNNINKFDKNTTLYVRYKETIDYFPSNYKILNF